MDYNEFQCEAEDVELINDWANPFDPIEDYLEDLAAMKKAKEEQK